LNSNVERKPWIALLLGIFIQPLSWVYVGRLGTGLVVYSAVYGLIAFMGWTGLIQSVAGYYVSIVLVLALALISILVPFAIAKSVRSNFTPRWYNRWYGYLLALCIVAIPSVLITPERGRFFGFESFRIPSGAMMPTLEVGDYLIVDSRPRTVTKINRGDVFVFRYPNPEHNPRKEGLNYIKRVIGLPGDEVTYRGKTLYINGKEVPQTDIGPFIGSGNEGRRMAGAEIHEEMLSEAKHQILKSGLLIPGREGTWRVLAGQYFAIGDNRDNSEDSRYWGAVPGQNVVGKASVVWMHWDTEGGFNWSRVGRIQ